MKKIITLIFAFALFVTSVTAQTGNVGIGTFTPTSTLQVNGSLAVGYRSLTASATLNSTDYAVEYSGTTAGTLTLPDATTSAGRIYVIKNTSTTQPTPLVILSPQSGQTIDGKNTWTLDAKNEVVTITSNGSNWTINIQSIPTAKTDSTGGTWNEGGNFDPSTAVRKFGTLSNNDIPVITNNVERMRVTKTGNIGIGTSSPAAKLEINSGTANTSGLKFTNLNNGSPTTSSTALLGVDAAGNVVVSGTASATTGPTGPSGANGTNGTNGAVGATGPAGTNGTNGSVGPTGPVGAAGINGTNGLAGATGSAGPTGAAGTNGTNGATGANGTNGATGPVGPTGPATGWAMTGNSGTTAGTNFVGTTDNQSLVFKANSVESGRIDLTLSNTSFGYQTAGAITTGTAGTYLGYQAGYRNTTGGNNTAVGSVALSANTTGASNTAIGANALKNATTASGNTAVGISAMSATTTGGSNSSFGAYSLQVNTSGSGNTAQGYSTLGSNTTGTNNTATGGGALQTNTTGLNNTAQGSGALQFATTANNNTSVGAYSSQYTTTGASNTALGYGASGNTTTGSYNTIMGNSAGATNTTGTNNTLIGSNADVSSAALTNAAAIGYNAKVATSNSLVLGGTGLNGVNVGIGTTSPASMLDVANGVTTNNTVVNATGSINDFLEYNIQNTSVGTHAQSGYSASADNGTATTGFAWLGINNSTFNYPTTYNIGGPNDVSMLASGQDMYIANANNTKSIIFSTGTATTPFFAEKMRITNAGNVGIGTASPGAKLEISSGTSGTSGLKFTNMNSSSTAATSALLGVDATGNVVVSSSGNTFTGSTASTAGTTGMIPAPAVGTQNKFLTGSGGWAQGFPLITANGTSTATTETRDFNAWVTKGTGFYITDVAAAPTNPIPNESAWFEFSQAANSGGYFGQTSLNDHNFYYRGGSTASLTATVWQKMLSIPASSQTKISTDATNNATLNVVDNAALAFATNNVQRVKIDSLGNTGFGTNSPSARLEVSSGTANLSGLKFTNMTKTSTITSGAAMLGVDASGNVVLASATTNGRSNYVLVKSQADLPAAVGGVITLLANTQYEVNGQVIMTAMIDVNQGVIKGGDATDDMLVYTPASGALFSGANGGVIKDLTLIAMTSGGSIFNINAAGAAQNLIVQHCFMVNSASLGTIKGFTGTVYLESVAFQNNTNGITYQDNTNFVEVNMLWDVSNHNTYEKFVGTFGVIQILGGDRLTSATNTATGIDITGITSISSGSVKQLMFTGTGTYVNGTFSNAWEVESYGLNTQKDDVSNGCLYMSSSAATTFSAANTATKILGTTATASLFRTTSPSSNKLTYIGGKTKTFTAICSLTGTQTSSAITYSFYIAKNGTILPESKQQVRFTNSTDLQSVTVSCTVSMAPNDYVEVWAANNTDMTALTVPSMNLAIK